MINCYLSEKTVAEISYLLWLSKTKETLKTLKTWRTNNFELMLLFAFKDIIGDAFTVEILPYIQNNIYNRNFMELMTDADVQNLLRIINSNLNKNYTLVDLINKELKNKNICFLPKIKDKTQVLNISKNQFKQDILNIIESINARSGPPFNNYPCLEGFHYYMHLRPPNYIHKQISKYLMPYCKDFFVLYFEDWLIFNFELEDLNFGKLKKFFNGYLENFKNNKLSFALLPELLEELTGSGPTNIGNKLTKYPDLKEAYSKMKYSKIINPQLTISKTKEFLDKLLAETGNLQIYFFNKIEPYDTELKNYEKFYLNFWGVFQNTRARVIESIFLLEKEGEVVFKDVIYNPEELKFTGILLFKNKTKILKKIDEILKKFEPLIKLVKLFKELFIVI